MNVKRADAASWLPAIAMALAGGALMWVGRQLQTIDNALADLGGED